MYFFQALVICSYLNFVMNIMFVIAGV